MQGEVAFAGAVVGPVQAAVERQDQGHGMFGDRMGGIGRDPYHIQPQALGRAQVDVVVTGRAQSDQAGATGSQLFQYRGTEVVVDKGTDHFMAFSQGGGIQAQACGLELQFDACWQLSAEETLAVVVLAAEKNRTHGCILVRGAQHGGWAPGRSCPGSGVGPRFGSQAADGVVQFIQGGKGFGIFLLE